MRLGKRVRLGGLGPSLGAAASLVAAGVALVLVVAGMLGAPVWPGASDAQGEELTLAAPPVSDVAVPEPVGGTDFAAERSRRPRPSVPPASGRARGHAARRRAGARRGPRRRPPRADDARGAEHARGERLAARDRPAVGPTAVATAARPPPRSRNRPRPRLRLSPGRSSRPCPPCARPSRRSPTRCRRRWRRSSTQVLDTVEQTAATVDQTLDPVTGLLKRKP